MIINGREPACDQRGAAAVELALLVPALLLVLGLLVAGGRLWFARTTVNEAAQTAARAASRAAPPMSKINETSCTIRAPLERRVPRA